MRMSASRSDCRNSAGPSKSRIRIRTEPRPCATCESEPAPGDDAVLGGEAGRLVVEGADRHARVEDLDRVDLVEVARAGARSRGPSACGRTGGARRRARPARGSRRSSRAGVSPRGIFSSRNRPITSPWPAVLISSPTITLTPAAAACARASSAPGDLVVVGDRDRAQALLRARSRAAPRPASRSRASGRCACAGRRRSAGAARARARSASSPLGGVAAGGERRGRSRSSSLGGRRVVVGDQPVLAGEVPAISSAVAGVLAMRASSRPKKLSTKRRASSVESRRSAEEWNEPTFSAREWRSAALEVLGANGSWTWTKSSSTVPSSSSTVRATSIGSAAGRRRAPGTTSSTSPTANTRGSPPSVPASSGRPRLAARGAQRAARVAHALLRARRRDDQHAVPAPRELAARRGGRAR